MKSPRGETDWAAVKRRLADAIRATDEAARLPPEQARRILDERARRLAIPPPAPERPGELLEVVVFALGAERYAIEARHVREIARFSDFTPVPGAADGLVGVTNLRGEILAVFDLRRLFGLAVPALSDLARVIVLGAEVGELGILADDVSALERLRAHELSGAASGNPCIRGITREALIVLDGERLLADPRFTIDHGRAAERAEGDS